MVFFIKDGGLSLEYVFSQPIRNGYTKKIKIKFSC